MKNSRRNLGFAMRDRRAAERALERGEIQPESRPTRPAPNAYVGKVVHMGRARTGPAAQFTACGAKAVPSSRVVMVYPGDEQERFVSCAWCLAQMATKAS